MSTETIRAYRATFILDSRGFEEPVETLAEKLKDTITSLDCEVGEVEILGKKDFARVTDRDHPGDTYLRMDFAGPCHSPETLREKLRLDTMVKRIFVELRRE